jgi:GMP synthase (glutamine-hydrolysing)
LPANFQSKTWLTMQDVVIIRHHEGDLHDLATTHLQASGYRIIHCYPFKGDSIPALGEQTAGTIVMGGAQNVSQIDQHPYLTLECDWIRRCIDAERPVVGICLGAQLLAHALGAAVKPHPQGICEFGYTSVSPTDQAGHWLPQATKMVEAHFEGFELPAEAIPLASSEHFAHQAFRVGDRAFGLQFHPEVSQQMFSEWQVADWAAEFNNTPGAQPVDEQTRDNQLYSQAQADWFHGFLDKLFAPQR